MSFKILSDFDGVWTDPVQEAESVRGLMEAETARAAGVAEEAVARDFEAFRELAMQRPGEHGWAPPAFTGGRVTAFVDEDPFCAGNAIATVLGAVSTGEYKLVDPGLAERAAAYAAAILARGFGTGFANTADFADRVFLDATAAYQLEHEHALVEGAAAIAAELLGLGCELVLVSNSHTQKLLDWFGAVGIACHDAQEPAQAPDSIALRGSAGKFILGPSNDALEVAGRTIYLDRPQYRRVLEEEAPDLVIGDVFSLDLALPAAMRAADEPTAPRELVLRRHAYSPTWSSDERAGGRIDHVIDTLDELPALAARLGALSQ
jgi:phosphoglycolate phosphatase-like HAD superfamily hydrolase